MTKSLLRWRRRKRFHECSYDILQLLQRSFSILESDQISFDEYAFGQLIDKLKDQKQALQSIPDQGVKGSEQLVHSVRTLLACRSSSILGGKLEVELPQLAPRSPQQKDTSRQKEVEKHTLQEQEMKEETKEEMKEDQNESLPSGALGPAEGTGLTDNYHATFQALPELPLGGLPVLLGCGVGGSEQKPFLLNPRATPFGCAGGQDVALFSKDIVSPVEHEEVGQAAEVPGGSDDRVHRNRPRTKPAIQPTIVDTGVDFVVYKAANSATYRADIGDLKGKTERRQVNLKTRTERLVFRQPPQGVCASKVVDPSAYEGVWHYNAGFREAEVSSFRTQAALSAAMLKIPFPSNVSAALEERWRAQFRHEEESDQEGPSGAPFPAGPVSLSWGGSAEQWARARCMEDLEMDLLLSKLITAPYRSSLESVADWYGYSTADASLVRERYLGDPAALGVLKYRWKSKGLLPPPPKAQGEEPAGPGTGFQQGRDVIAKDLKNQLGREMNGKKGKLQSFNQQTGRWAAKFDGFEQPIHLLEANLELAGAPGPAADTQNGSIAQEASALAPTQPASWGQLKDRGNVAFKDAGSDPEQTLVALRFYQQAMALGPPPQGVALLHNNSAAVRLQRGEHELALRHCEEALLIEPDNPKAHFRAAKAAKGLNRIEQALRHCSRGLDVRLRDASLLALRADISAMSSTRVDEPS